MLLFPQKTDANIDSTGKQFYVLSPRVAVNEQLCALFRLAGFNAVKGIEQDFNYLEEVTIPVNTSGVVVDIGASTQVEVISHLLQVHIPRTVWCCVVGDSDSIILLQSFIRNNIHYFNINAQQEMIVEAATYGVEIKEKRRAVSISILGCKGGVGSTTIGYQLANEIARIKQISTIFIQGSRGSRDLDLHAGKKLLPGITPAQKYFDLMVNQGEQFPDLEQDLLQGYNFVLFEQIINTADKEQLRHLAESSLCLVLLIDRSMASIRVARNMIENIDLLQRTSRGARRLFICLSDTRPIPMDALSKEDIQSLLGRQIDILFPYNKQVKSRRSPFTLFSSAKTPLDTLTHYVLGGGKSHKASLINRILARKNKEVL